MASQTVNENVEEEEFQKECRLPRGCRGMSRGSDKVERKGSQMRVEVYVMTGANDMPRRTKEGQ